MRRQGAVMLTAALLAGAGAKEMNIFEKWRYSHERREAVKEWQAITKGRDANYQQALMTFEQFDKKFTASPEEKEQFRHWKKSVRSTVTPDGIIFNPKTYIDELNQFRTASMPIPNPEEEPVFYPAPAASGTKVYLQVPNGSSAGDWKSMGYRGNPRAPGQGSTGNGAVTGIAIDPNNPAIVYTAVRNGGLWKSFDYGVTYMPLTDYFASPQIEGVGIGTNNSQVLYLSQPGRIWFSDDGGLSWEDRSAGFSGSADEIHVDPADANRALAASDKGLYLTSDGGLNWSKVMDGVIREIETTANWHTLGIGKDGGNTKPSYFVSTDRGSTWTEKMLPSPLDAVTRVYLTFHDRPKPDSLVIYAMVLKNGSTPTHFTGLYRSNDAGKNFTEVKAADYSYPNGPVLLAGSSAAGYTELGNSYGGVLPYSTSSWVGEFGVSPVNPNHLFTMREKMWCSVDGGITWAMGPSYGGHAWADRRFAAPNPTKDSLYFSDDGGAWAVPFSAIFPWTGDGKSVVSKNGNIAAPEGTNLTTSTYSKEVFMTGGQDVGQVFQRNGKTFHTQLADVYRGKICPYNDSIYWTGDYTIKITADSSVQLYNQVEPDHFNPKRIYGFSKAGQLYRTKTGEDAWKSPVGRSSAFGEQIDLTSTGVTTWGGWTFEQSRANPELAFIGDQTGKQLFMTENLSASVPTWKKVASAPALGRWRIATHPFNEKLVAAAGDKAVWISRDKGVTWEELSGYPASGTINLFFDKNTAEGLYACNSMTVWYRDETLSNWIEFNRGLPLQNIAEMEIRYYPDGDSRLWVSKYGRGVWSTPLYSAGKIKSIKADFAFHGRSGESGLFKAGDTIQLNDLSMGTVTNRSWSITGPESITAGNDSMPKFTFTQPGVYSASLKVTGLNGSDSCFKAGYFRIAEKIRPADSIPANGTGGQWYLGIKSVTVNGVVHGSNGNTNAFYEDETDQTPFTNLFTSAASVSIVPTSNDGTWGVSYAKVYVDFNGSGSFQPEELVYDKSDGRSQGHAFTFTAPAGTVKNMPLRMRVLVNRTSVITNAYQGQVDQGQAEDHIIIFTTPQPAVTVDASAAGTDSLVLLGAVSGAGTIIDQGFIYTSGSSVPSMANSARISAGTKQFAAGVGSLPKNQTFFVRSYVIDQYGTWLSPVDTVVPASFTAPILDVLTPVFSAGKWTAKGRIHAENGNVSSAVIEYGAGGRFDFRENLSINGVRNQWDTVSALMPNLARYSDANYRIRAVINGKTFVSAIRKFSSEKDLYAYWTFDETGAAAFDYSGNGRIAVLGSTLTRIPDDRGGSALLFDASDETASIGLANLPQPFTLMCRVKRTADSPVGNAVILDGSSRRVDLEVWNKTRRVGASVPGTYDRASGYTAPIGEWHSITMVGVNDSIRLYIDGTYHSSLSTVGFALPLNSFGKAGSSMIGALDEVKVYTAALSGEQITEALKMPQRVVFSPIPNSKAGAAPFTLSAVSSKGSAVRFELVSGSEFVTLSGSSVTPTAAGIVTVRAVVDGSASLLADTAVQSFTILPADAVSILDRKNSSFAVEIVPNPVRFGVDSRMVFTIPAAGIVSAEVVLFDPVGNRVNHCRFIPSGTDLRAEWNLTNSAGAAVGSGAYSAVIQAEFSDGSKKMVRKMIGAVR